MSRDDESELLRKYIISDTFNIPYKQLHIINPNIIPSGYNKKDIILDILAETDKGLKINIEMQLVFSEEYLHKRFQYYGSKILSRSLEKGQTYDTLQPVYQIIFLSHNPNTNRLFDIFISKNEYNEKEKPNLIHRILVYVPFINEIAKNKKFNINKKKDVLIHTLMNTFNCTYEEAQKLINSNEQKNCGNDITP